METSVSDICAGHESEWGTTRLHCIITQNTSKDRNSSSKDPLIGNYAKKTENVKTSTP